MAPMPCARRSAPNSVGESRRTGGERRDPDRDHVGQRAHPRAVPRSMPAAAGANPTSRRSPPQPARWPQADEVSDAVPAGDAIGAEDLPETGAQRAIDRVARRSHASHRIANASPAAMPPPSPDARGRAAVRRVRQAWARSCVVRPSSQPSSRLAMMRPRRDGRCITRDGPRRADTDARPSAGRSADGGARTRVTARRSAAVRRQPQARHAMIRTTPFHDRTSAANAPVCGSTGRATSSPRNTSCPRSSSTSRSATAPGSSTRRRCTSTGSTGRTRRPSSPASSPGTSGRAPSATASTRLVRRPRLRGRGRGHPPQRRGRLPPDLRRAESRLLRALVGRQRVAIEDVSEAWAVLPIQGP